MEKVAIITGASSGIGYALAKKFKKEGFKVINLSRRDSNISDINISILYPFWLPRVDFPIFKYIAKKIKSSLFFEKLSFFRAGMDWQNY